MNNTVIWFKHISTLVCRIDVHARLLILRKKFPLHGLIWPCTFIVFEKKNPPARLFFCVYKGICPARLLILRKKSPLHGLIWVCTFIVFEKKFPPIGIGITMSNLEKKGGQWLSCHALVTLAISWTYSKSFLFKAVIYIKTKFDQGCNCTLAYQKISPLHGLILVCTFIDFEKKIPPARLFGLH